MENLIDKLHCEYAKCSELLDRLSDELEKIQNGKSADYYLMLEAVLYLETHSEPPLVTVEQIDCTESSNCQDVDELNEIIVHFYSEISALRNLTHKVRGYIDAAIEDCLFKVEPFESRLKACIHKQRNHLDTGEFVILPLLEEKISKTNVAKH
jgi:hemerythrin-like domain-containing protein